MLSQDIKNLLLGLHRSTQANGGVMEDAIFETFCAHLVELADQVQILEETIVPNEARTARLPADVINLADEKARRARRQAVALSPDNGGAA